MTTEITAPMPGTIVDVKVKVGEKVLAGQDVVVLESMKMENPIRATADGTVKEIKVANGDKVPAKQVLVIIE
jgi:biotin carboxyl carrier protein